MLEAGKVKVNVALDRHIHQSLTENVPWGMRNMLVGTVLNLILDSIKAAGPSGPIVLGAIVAGQYKLVRDEDVEQPSK